MSADHERVFKPRTAALLILIGGAAFCAVLVLLVLVDPADRLVVKPSSFSRSAIGHAAFASLLRESGYRVGVNRGRQGRVVAAEDLLLVLEPDLHTSTVADLQRLLEGKRRVLVALPKWRERPTGMPSGLPPGWIEGAVLLSETAVGKVAQTIDGEATVHRPGAKVAWTGALGTPEIEQPQLLTGSALRPLVASSDGGILVGQAPDDETGSRTLVLADPDLVANHGLHRGDNATLALAVIEQLVTSPDATIHFDESLHGFAILPSLPRLLMAPPFLAATLLALATVAVIVWRAAVGFGIDRAGEEEKTPVFGSGHETLLRNAGRLLVAGDDAAYIADCYASATLEEAGRRLHVDRQPAELRGTLQGIADRRGVRTRLPDAETVRPLAKARRYYDWMEEMFGGSRSGRDPR